MIRAKASKKRCNSISNYYSDESDSDSSLSINSNWDTYIRPAGHKETNKLYNVVIDNIKTNKYQLNEVIHNDTTFDTSIFNSSSGTIYPLPVLTVNLQGCKKNIATTVAGLTCLWDSGATDSMANRKTLNTMNQDAF